MLILADHHKPFLSLYSDGDFAHLQMANEISSEDLDELGDGLLRFILVETSSGEDCEDGEEAIRRLEKAALELQNVYHYIWEHQENLAPENGWSGIQKLVIEGYDKDFQYLIEDGRQGIDLDRLGDGLLTYLLRELSAAEDCTDCATALARIERSMDDLTLCISSIREMEDESLWASDGL